MSSSLGDTWRKLSWGENQTALKFVKSYKPENITHLRVLLHGPVGSGKSSFISSVSSVLQGRTAIPALASSTTSDRSFTVKYQTHKIKAGRGSSASYYSVVFNDIMGLEDGNNSGIHHNDIKLAMKGHVREGHKFNPVAPLSSQDHGYNPKPTADDEVHVLVCVLSANSSEIKQSVLEKMNSVRQMASEMGIPQLAIVTKIDEACPETEKDLRNVYKSKHLRKKMSEFSSAIGIPMNCIFPVKNYSHEISMNPDADTLILSALEKMINFGDDFIENHKRFHSRIGSLSEIRPELKENTHQ